MADYYKQRAKDKNFIQKKEAEKTDMKLKQKTFYAGIGSRKTPPDILALMERLAAVFAHDGLILRTGHAKGADQAFEAGARAAAQIFLPWPSYEQDAPFWTDHDENESIQIMPVVYEQPTMEAADVAANVHFVFDQLSPGAKKLHARNAHIILGPAISEPAPVEFVICWTPDAQSTGGTATAMAMAMRRNIPVWNLALDDVYDMAFEWAWDIDLPE